LRAEEKTVTKGKATDSNRRNAWGRYLLVFFVAAWMFVLGVLVGRGTAPVHFDIRALQEELAELRSTALQKEREAVEKAMRGEDERAPLEFYEALKTDEPDTGVHIPAPQAAPPARVATEASAPPTVASPPHKSRTTLMAKKRRVATQPDAAPRPVSRADSQGSQPAAGLLTIQVASMKDAAAAERAVAKLKGEGYSAYLSRIVIAGKGLWFRVRVGHYKTREQAAADMARLTRSQHKPMLVSN
jgi:cell division septation protein DedD